MQKHYAIFVYKCEVLNTFLRFSLYEYFGYFRGVYVYRDIYSSGFSDKNNISNIFIYNSTFNVRLMLFLCLEKSKLK